MKNLACTETLYTNAPGPTGRGAELYPDSLLSIAPNISNQKALPEYLDAV